MVTRGCVRGVVQLVTLVDAAGIHNNVILHEGEIASLRRFENVGLAGDASCSSSLRTNVSWREGPGSLGRAKWMCHTNSEAEYDTSAVLSVRLNAVAHWVREGAGGRRSGWGRQGMHHNGAFARNLEAICDARKLARVGEFLGDDITTTTWTITGR